MSHYRKVNLGPDVAKDDKKPNTWIVWASDTVFQIRRREQNEGPFGKENSYEVATLFVVVDLTRQREVKYVYTYCRTLRGSIEYARKCKPVFCAAVY